MRVDLYEKIWIWLTLAVMAVFMIAVLTAAFEHGIKPVAPTGQIDPQTLASTAPFDEPGVFEQGPGEYRVVMRAKMWTFDPPEVRVPAGSTVTFQITSEDVLHGFRVMDTNLNVMLIPGEISTVTGTFEEPGEYWFVCHEYCGVAHQSMAGRLIVEEAAAQAEPAPDEEEQSS